MQVIENQSIRDGVVSLDDKIFRNCHYFHCQLIYAGGNVAFEPDTTFRQCRITFVEAATRTIHFMEAWGYKITAPTGTKREFKKQSETPPN